MYHPFRRFLLLAFLSSIALPSTVPAQTGQMFGEVVGKVTDQQDAVLPGASVTLSGPALMGTQTTTSNERGLYRFPAVPSGVYTLRFELAGFTTLAREEIVVSVRSTVTVDATLRVATLAETLTVTGESPVVDLENTKVGERLDQQILTEVPTARSIFGSATLLPGVVMGRQDVGGLFASTSTGMTAHGAGAYNLNYFGVTADTPQDYGSMYYMDFGSAEEISVDTAAMGAEIGGGGGANINIIPKSGGNAIKGAIYFNGTGDGLAGNNVDQDLRAQGITTGTAILRLYDTNVDAGGPFRRDRAWWYGSLRNYTTYENVIGFPKEFKANLRNYSLRATFRLSDRNNLSAFWTHNTKAQPNRGAGVTRPTPESTWNQRSPKNLENLNWTSVVTSSTFLEASSSMFRMYWPTTYSREWYALSTPIPPSQDLTTGIFFGAHTDGERLRDAYRLQLNAGLTHYRDGWLGGSHQIKLGYEMWHGWGDESFSVFGDTRYRYRNAAPAEIFVYNTPLVQRTHMRNFAGFVQDRASYGRVTLNLGLRYSFYDGWLPEQEGGGGRWFPRRTYPRQDAPFNWSNFAPRVGAVVKLDENGRSVAKASYSRYFEHMYTWYFTLINPNIIRTGGVATYRWFGDRNSNGVVDDGEYDPKPLSVFEADSNSIDPDFKQPKADEIMVGYQRELAPNLGVQVGWIQRWYTDNWADVNVGIPPSAYDPQTFPDAGPDNIVGTGDDRSITLHNLRAQFLGEDVFRRQTVPGTTRYRGLELSINKRMANRWQLMGSYVWSRLDGIISEDREVGDPNDPNQQLESHKFGRGSVDQPHALKLMGSYRAPWDVSIGANVQLLSGLPRNRDYRRALRQGSTTVRAEPRGTYREDTLRLLSLRASKSVRVTHDLRLSGFAELHNALNSNAAQSFSTLTQSFASREAFEAARARTAYFGRVAEILPPRIAKFGVKLEF